MAVWSLIATYFSDPGYIPVNYIYDESKFIQIVAQIFAFIQKNKDYDVKHDEHLSYQENMEKRKRSTIQVTILTALSYKQKKVE